MSDIQTITPARQTWADRINAAWHEALGNVLETGFRLINAKSELAHGEFLAMVESDLVFSARTAQRLIKIGQDERLTNATHVSHLPTSWGTLYELTQLDDDTFAHGISAGLIKADMQRSDVRRLKAQTSLTSPAPTWPSGTYALLYADPPWRYEHPPIGASNRSIENHYPTMDLEEICALPVPSLVHDDALLFLWATSPKLYECMAVIDAWGFQYRTCMVWVKDKIGMGYHSRNKHEILLIAKCGTIAPPDPSDRPASVIEAPRLEHSAKPPVFHELIESMYPGLPKIELFARAPRPGWAVWGNQVDAA